MKKEDGYLKIPYRLYDSVEMKYLNSIVPGAFGIFTSLLMIAYKINKGGNFSLSHTTHVSFTELALWVGCSVESMKIFIKNATKLGLMKSNDEEYHCINKFEDYL